MTIFNYKGNKYGIDFFEGNNTKCIIYGRVTYYHGQYIRHTARMVQYSKDTKISDIIK